METISRSLLTFLLNSLWQIPVAAAVAAVACRIMRNGPASHRHAVWVAALVASVLLPLASMRSEAPTQRPQYSASLADDARAHPAVRRTLQQVPAAPAPAASRTVSLAATTASILLGAYFLFVLFRFARLAWASLRTAQIRRTVLYRAIPGRIDRVWTRCQEAFGLSGVELLVSAQVSGPVTAGRSIILPEALLAEQSEDVLTTAIGHEMAHIARHDFACNVFYEVLLSAIGFHPASWMMQREIERTREMACDELVTQRLMDAGVYARSIMSIANDMMALPRPGYTLGVFDGDILETRIRSLVSRPATNLKRARMLLASGLAALALFVVMASSLSLTARAQGAASGLMKQAEAAFNRGEFAAAAELFENAVRVEPGNLKAKLLLATALLSQWVPGPDSDVSVVARVRKQYLDVLAAEPGNRQGLHGLMALDLNTKQFDAAREWALKAIAADAKDAAAYYTLGFIDWCVTYPDYAKARQAAGMKLQDPGIIPDASLRQQVKTQHGAHLDEGFRVLQVAINLDPDFSDAMAYINLLYRIQSAIADTDAQSKELVALADSWVSKALDAKRRMAQKPRPLNHALDVDGPVLDPIMAPPPPPPPPPPPGSGEARVEAPGAIRMRSEDQQARLVKQIAPEYPAGAAGASGTVRMSVLIGKDGRVRDVQVMTAPGGGFAKAAMQAVSQWVYQPALVNGQPVEVATTVEVNFAAR